MGVNRSETSISIGQKAWTLIDEAWSIAENGGCSIYEWLLWKNRLTYLGKLQWNALGLDSGEA